MLKVEFHSHTNYLQTFGEGKMSPKELIDAVKAKGYDVLAITEHYNQFSKQKMFHQDPLKTYYDFKEYAREKGILLIPGAEIRFKEGEVLLINFKGNAKDYVTLKDLEKLPRSTLVAAPHPFFKLNQCLGADLEPNIDKFDAIEHSFFYTKRINANKKAIALADRYGKPLIGTSDVHREEQLDRNYTLVGSEKKIHSIIRAVRQNKIELVTKPLNTPTFSKMFAQMCLDKIGKLLS
ncbi:MAG: PHP domain-containing protein [archaeon]